MKISKLLIEGFRNIIYKEITFDSKGIVLVKGENGKGKSTIFESIVYAYYGETVKNTTLEKIITKKDMQPSDYRGCLVQVWDGDYHICRFRGFRGTINGLTVNGDGVMVFKNGTIVASKAAEAQELIDSITQMSKTIFFNSVFFGQGMKRLIDSDQKDRQTMFDTLFDNNLFQEASNKAHIKHSEYLTKINTIKTEIVRLEHSIEVIQVKVDSIQNDKFKKSIKDLTKDKTQLETKITHLEKELTEIHVEDSPMWDKLVEYNKINSECTKANNLAQELYYKKNIKIEEKTISEICSVCNGPLDKVKVNELKAKEKARLNELKEQKSELEKSYEDAVSMYDSLTTKKMALENDRQRFNETVGASKAQRDRRARIEQDILDLKSNIKSTERTIREFQSLIVDDIIKDLLLSEIKVNKHTIKELEAENGKNTNLKDIYGYWANIGFSDKGVKAYLLNANLNFFNNILSRYAEMLGVFIHFEVNTVGKSKKIGIRCSNSKGTVLDYEELSGGEKRRMDIIVSFSVFEAMRQLFGVTSNIIVLDEPFESLDEEGLDQVKIIVNKLAEKSQVFIISHLVNFDHANAIQM